MTVDDLIRICKKSPHADIVRVKVRDARALFDAFEEDERIVKEGPPHNRSYYACGSQIHLLPGAAS